MIPLIVVEVGPEEVARAAAEVRAAGWSTASGWAGPAPSAPVVRIGVVSSADTASAAVLAAVRGDGLVVDARAERRVVDRLCDDLRRLGSLDHRLTRGHEVELSVDQRALLDLLASGVPLGRAAEQLHLSRRTADRRLAAARLALGAASTTEAVVRSRRLAVGSRISPRT